MSTLVTNPIPLPYGDPISKPRDPFKGRDLQDVIEYLKGLKQFITEPWSQALDQQAQQLASAPTRVNSVSGENQSASIIATDLASSTLTGGLYEVRPYARIIQAASVSSSLQLVIGYTENGVVLARTFTAVTGNTITTIMTDPIITIHADPGTPITYAWTYASVGAPPMKYRYDLVLSQVTS